METRSQDLAFGIGLLVIAIGAAAGLSVLVSTGQFVVASAIYLVVVGVGCWLVMRSLREACE
ncbi:hypothetical protein [Aeromicrobium alkaliterrae]|uniref:Uncharacterized protein n=1 Tax=Aeromicrobium alkaliterrae TaxID=302168 RepID=A0ABP4VPA9_9ACTN